MFVKPKIGCIEVPEIINWFHFRQCVKEFSSKHKIKGSKVLH